MLTFCGPSRKLKFDLNRGMINGYAYKYLVFKYLTPVPVTRAMSHGCETSATGTGQTRRSWLTITSNHGYLTKQRVATDIWQ